MAFARPRAAFFGLVLLASATSAAISLSNFVPRVDKLPPPCAAVYNAGIKGCVEGDFIVIGGATSPPICSPSCVQGLLGIQEAILKNCAGVDVGEASMIGVFQSGLGLRALCPGVTVTSKSPDTAPSTTTQVAVETSVDTAITTISPPVILSTANAYSTSKADGAQPSSTSRGGSPVDPIDTTSNIPSSTVATPSSTPTKSSPGGANRGQAPNRQLSNADSGGGSPFDVVAVGLAPDRGFLGSLVSPMVAAAALLAAWR